MKSFPHWRDGRVVDYNGLENRRTERYRGFESLSLRKSLLKEISEGFFISVYFLHIHSLSMTRRLQMQNYAILFGHIKENM